MQLISAKKNEISIWDAWNVRYMNMYTTMLFVAQKNMFQDF